MTNKENNTDPLRNADIGTTRTITAQKDIETTHYLPEIYTGQDRISDPEVTSAEIVENDYGEQVIRLEFAGEVMKVLPERWDYAREPRTELEKNRATRTERYELLKQLIGVLLPMGIALGVGFYVMNQITPLQLEATTIPEPGVGYVGATIGFVVLMFLLILWAVRGGVPPRV